MTTNVRIEAHCGSDTEVFVNLTDDDEQLDEFVLRNGEVAERHIYGNRVIAVMERPRTEDEANDA